MHRCEPHLGVANRSWLTRLAKQLAVLQEELMLGPGAVPSEAFDVGHGHERVHLGSVLGCHPGLSEIV